MWCLACAEPEHHGRLDALQRRLQRGRQRRRRAKYVRVVEAFNDRRVDTVILFVDPEARDSVCLLHSVPTWCAKNMHAFFAWYNICFRCNCQHGSSGVITHVSPTVASCTGQHEGKVGKSTDPSRHPRKLALV